jgi:signal transduction histidine kinase
MLTSITDADESTIPQGLSDLGMAPTEDLADNAFMTNDLPPPQENTMTSVTPRIMDDPLSVNTEFLSALSHELRMPLATIRGFTQLLLTHWTDLPENKRLRNMEQIMRSTRRMERLVSDLALATRLGDTVEVQADRADLGKLVDQAIEEVSIVHEGRYFVVEQPTALPLAWADAERVGQILVNLLDNAAKYSPPTTPIVVRLHDEGDILRVEVADYGAGLTSEEQACLFVRFSRLRSTRNAVGLTAGTGLGLYICRRLIGAMGGTIGVRATEEGTGNTFWFTLPSAPSSLD